MSQPSHYYDTLPAGSQAPTVRQELRVVGVVIAFVVLLEIIARIIAPWLDYDRKNIHAFPQTISNLEQRAKSSGRPRVAFFGNSLMLRGLDESILQDELRELGGPAIETTKINPVGTAMIDWLYLYQRYFDTTASRPEVLVLGFVAHHIHDQEPIKIRRLARHFVAAQDFPTLWKTDLTNFHERAQSVLCGISALEGDQPEHQMLILDFCVADYQRGLNANHRLIETAATRQAQANRNRPSGGAAESFTRMQRFLELCESQQVKVLFVAMPLPLGWDLNPAAVSLARQHGMEMLDARAIDGMTKDDFSDGYHLGPKGAEKFSRWLADALHDNQPWIAAP